MHSASDARRKFAAQANPSARICNAADEVLCASNRVSYFLTLPKSHWDLAMSFEILGIGAPVLDHLIKISDEYLATIPGEKHGTETVDHTTMMDIIQKSHAEPIYITGGSCANAIKGLANLGWKCGVVGKIGNDSAGQIVKNHMQALGITTLYQKSNTPTAQVLCLITPDGKRTLRSYLGASKEMSPEELDPESFKGVKLVHIEGYTLLTNTLTQKAMELAKEAGASVSFDLGSFELVETYRDRIIELLKTYVDIVFGNADETGALTHLGPEQGCDFLKNLCNIAVVMMAKDGCWVGHEKVKIRCHGFPIEHPLDSTGAGDLFASGFLHGYLSGQPLDKCAEYGSRIAAEVVKVIGAEVPQHIWKRLLLNFNPIS